MELTVLGSSGTWPGPGRATCGYLLSHEGAHLWLDAGAGTFSRLQQWIRVDQMTGIVISHGHPDHFSDMLMCFYARRYGGLGDPGLPVFSPSDFTDKAALLVAEEGMKVLYEDFAFTALHDGDEFTIGPFEIKAIEMVHVGVEALGYRIRAGGVLFAYSGDGGPSDNLVEVARDADLFLCEATYQEGEHDVPVPFERPASGRARREGGREAADADPHRPDARPGRLGRGGIGRLRRAGLRRRRGLRGGDHRVTRPDARANDELRPVAWELGYQEWAHGSVLLTMGKTRVLIAASVSEDAPRWLKGTGKGWVTGEYSMLPASTNERSPREVNKGRPGGRTQEIQRLIGRSLRAVTDLAKLGERTITVDCDVLQADAGTRTASITGGYIALALALRGLNQRGVVPDDVLADSVAAVSVGIVDGEARLDLCYEEDAGADVDFNVVMTGSGDFVEVQGTAEGVPFTRGDLDALLDLAGAGIAELTKIQHEALGA